MLTFHRLLFNNSWGQNLHESTSFVNHRRKKIRIFLSTCLCSNVFCLTILREQETRIFWFPSIRISKRESIQTVPHIPTFFVYQTLGIRKRESISSKHEKRKKSKITTSVPNSSTKNTLKIKLKTQISLLYLTLARIWCNDRRSQCRSVRSAIPWNWIARSTVGPRQRHRIPISARIEDSTPDRRRYNSIHRCWSKDFRSSCRRPSGIDRSRRCTLPEDRIRWSIPGTRRHARAAAFSKSLEIRSQPRFEHSKAVIP